MSNTDFIPSPDPAFDAWLANFGAKCDTYSGDLNLTPAEVTVIQALASTFHTKLTEVNNGKDTLKGLVAGKDSNRKSTTTTVRGLAKQFKAIPGISPQILADLGIVSSSSAGPVVTVTGLAVVGCDDGVNKLTWNRSGNAQGTQFIIESSPTGNSDWDLVDVVTAVGYRHTNQIPGERQYYRIRSKRASTTSAPCAPVVVYANGGGPGLSVAA
jgi:hypothetical protein